MRETLLKILAFLLGFRHKSYDEHEAEGRKIRLAMINNKISGGKLGLMSEVYLIGAIEYSDAMLRTIKDQLLKGEIPNFTLPDFDPSKNYIDFYQIGSYENRYYICAFTDKMDFKDLDESLMLVEIKRRLSTSHLPQEAKYK